MESNSRWCVSISNGYLWFDSLATFYWSIIFIYYHATVDIYNLIASYTYSILVQVFVGYMYIIIYNILRYSD